MAVVSETRNKRFMYFSDAYPLPAKTIRSISKFTTYNAFLKIDDTIDDNHVLVQNSSYDSKLGLNNKSIKQLIFNPKEAVIEPHNIGLVPKIEWYPQILSLESLQANYFSKRSGAARQFDFKVYNALCITNAFPGAYNYIGIEWVDENTFKVDAKIFGTFLKMPAGDNSLYHKQGNFSTHGFEFVSKSSSPSYLMNPKCIGVDDSRIRLFIDTKHRFSRNTEFETANQIYSQ